MRQCRLQGASLYELNRLNAVATAASLAASQRQTHNVGGRHRGRSADPVTPRERLVRPAGRRLVDAAAAMYSCAGRGRAAGPARGRGQALGPRRVTGILAPAPPAHRGQVYKRAAGSAAPSVGPTALRVDSG